MKDLAARVISVAKKEVKPKFIPMARSDRDQAREIAERVPDISKAKTVLDYEPEVDLDQGIAEVIAAGQIKETWFDPMDRG